jgi:hypothetical protein
MQLIARNLNKHRWEGEFRKMKNSTKIKTIIFLLMLVLTTLPMLSWAAEESEQAPAEDKVTGEVAASVLSAYIWRGQELTRHSLVIQPSMTVGYKGFTANIWGNLDTDPYLTDNEESSSNFTETDITLSYTHKIGIVSAGVGYIYYDLSAPTSGEPDLLDSQEIFATVGLDAILAPTLTVYKEIAHYHQWYATLGISHTFVLHEKVSLKLAAQASYLKSEDEASYPKYNENSSATSEKFNNFHDGVFSISLPVLLSRHVTLTPTLTYVFPLSKDAKYEMRARGLESCFAPSDKDSSFLYGGINLRFAF